MSTHHTTGDQSQMARHRGSLETLLPREILDTREMLYFMSPLDPGCHHLGTLGGCSALRALEGAGLEALLAAPGVEATATVGELTRSDTILCTECGPYKSFVGASTPGAWVDWALLADTLLAQTSESTHGDALRERTSTCQSLLHSLEAVVYSATPHYPDGGRSILEKHAQYYQDELTRITLLQNSSAGQESLLREIQALLVGEEALQGGYPLEDDLCLVGIFHCQRHNEGTILGDVIQLFRIWGEKGGPVVLRLPRYGATWLTQLGGEEEEVACLPVGITGTSADLQETAAALWDPTSGGPLQSMLGALQAARNLHAPAAY